MSSIGVIIPSYHDDNSVWRSMFLSKMIPSLVNLMLVDNLKFLVNLQGYSDDELLEISGAFDQVIKCNSTWEYNLLNNPKYNQDTLSMVRIRNDAMIIDPNLEYYIYTDDDIVYHDGSGKRYSFILTKMKENPGLGMVMSAGFLGGYNYVDKLKLSCSKHWMNNRGLIFRNLHYDKSPIYPDYVLDNHRGGFEDMLVAVSELSSGYALATDFNNPASHKATKMDDSEDHKSYIRYDKDIIHDQEVTFSRMKDLLNTGYGISTNGVSKLRDFGKIMDEVYYSHYVKKASTDLYITSNGVII